jgi:arylsulfatase A-like enzyme
MAIRQGDWKLVKYDPVVDGAKGKATAAKLYNLADDVGEAHDLMTEQPEKAAELKAAWDAWNKDNVAAKWGAGGKGKAKAKGKRRAARQGA